MVDLASPNSQLSECEERIARGISALLVDAGGGLFVIRENRQLVKDAGFPSFERYCLARWGLTIQHATRLIKAYRVYLILKPHNEPVGSVPQLESSLRPLTSLLPDEDAVKQTWSAIAPQFDGVPTAKQVTEAVAAHQAGNFPKLVEQETCCTDDLHGLIEKGKTFGNIYCDPPWAYGNQATRAATDNHYETVSVDWLCDPDNMPVEALSMDKAHLHLWTTNAFLFDAKRIIEAWGFEYKSCFVWVKTQMGIGNYWRVSHEFLLLGVRGGVTFADRSLMSWHEFPRTKHSEKPSQIQEMIERASPTPRLELFARKVTPGWTCWGNEVSRDLLSMDAQAV